MRKEEYLALRNEHLPTNLKIVFILESPPASGKYFYDEQGSVNEPLFSAMMKLLNYKLQNKRDGLCYFANTGHFLVDATYEPVNEFSDTVRDRKILANFESLVSDLENLNYSTQTEFILVKANICRLLETRLKDKGFKIRNNGIVVPFPSTGQQTNFSNEIKQIYNSPPA
jgi:hypothetical protein